VTPFRTGWCCPPGTQVLGDVEVRVILDAGNEPAVTGLNTVEQTERVETVIQEDECASYSLAGG